MEAQFRHGDILFVATKEVIPAEAKLEKRVKGRLIVAAGEVTGHHHAIAEKDASILNTPDGIRWLTVQTVAHINHEEHRTIELPAGNYRIIQQRVFHSGKIQRVQD